MPFVGTRRKRARKREVSSLQLGSPRRRSNLGESPGTRELGGGGGGPRRVPSQHGAPHRPPAAVPPHWRVCARVCPVCRPPAHARSVRSSPGQSSRSGGGGGDGGGGGCGVRVEEDGGSERLGVPPAVRNPECGKRGLGRSASAQILSPAPSPSSPAEHTRERGAGWARWGLFLSRGRGGELAAYALYATGPAQALHPARGSVPAGLGALL